VTVARARKVQRFLSQPMYVAEVFTGLPGVTTPVDETVDSFEALCNGDLDDLPEQAFLNVGGAEAARAKAAELRKSAGERGFPHDAPGPGGLARAHLVVVRGLYGLCPPAPGRR